MIEEVKKFSALSSDGITRYCVEIDLSGAQPGMRCDCAAGAIGKICRHKTAILSGDTSMLTSDDEVVVLQSVLEKLVGTRLMATAIELTQAENRLATAKQEVEMLRKRLALVMRANS